MKTKLTIIISFFFIIIFSGCDTYSVYQRSLMQKDASQEDMYGAACPSPTYVATMGIDATSSDSIISQEKLTLYNMLNAAKKKYGEDVTIQNVRWDKKNKKNISAIFDVVKCK